MIRATEHPVSRVTNRDQIAGATGNIGNKPLTRRCSGRGLAPILGWRANSRGRAGCARSPGSATIDGNGEAATPLNAQSLSLNYTVPAGSVPGFANCLITGTGGAGVTNTTITGSVTVTAASCEGAGHPTTGIQPLSLTRP